MLRSRSCLFASALLWACSSTDDSRDAAMSPVVPSNTAVSPAVTPGGTAVQPPVAPGSGTTAVQPVPVAPVTPPTPVDSTTVAPNQPVTPGVDPAVQPTVQPPAVQPTGTTDTTSVAPDTTGSTEPDTTTTQDTTLGDTSDVDTSADATNTDSMSTTSDDTTDDPGPAPMMRTECPEAPPAETKDPAASLELAISKDEYEQMLDRQEPFVGTRSTLPWHMYTPEQAAGAPSEQFPLLVVLHGGYGGQVIDGHIRVDVAQYLLGSANGLLTEANRQAYPTFIIAPQCRMAGFEAADAGLVPGEEACNFGGNEWASAGGANFYISDQPSVSGGTALELIQQVIDTYPIDPSRVYITGNSMGGGGTWEFAQRHPELFAAALPVSGHTPNLEQLKSIANAKLPVWAFGGKNDFKNPYTDTLAAVEYINRNGGCAWLTTYSNAAHDDDLWSSPYLEPGLWPWLFAQRNPSAL